MAASQVSGPSEEPIETHLLEIWPAGAHEAPTVVHGPDALAGYLVG
jgi:hypothetical protein